MDFQTSSSQLDLAYQPSPRTGRRTNVPQASLSEAVIYENSSYGLAIRQPSARLIILVEYHPRRLPGLMRCDLPAIKSRALLSHAFGVRNCTTWRVYTFENRLLKMMSMAQMSTSILRNELFLRAFDISKLLSPVHSCSYYIIYSTFFV